MREKFIGAGKTAVIKNGVAPVPTGQVLEGKTFEVEDYWQNVYGQSWMSSDGNPAAIMYGMRAGFSSLPTDNEVVYGKVDGLGVLLHVSEFDVVED